MNIRKLSEIITEMEGKKQSISIAQVKEVLACLSDHVYAWADECNDLYLIGEMFHKNGARRAKAKSRTKRRK